MNPQNENKGFLSKLLGDVNVNTQVGLDTTSLTNIGLILFISAALIMLAFFTFKKFLK